MFVYQPVHSLLSFDVTTPLSCSALIGYTENQNEEAWKGYVYACLFFVNGVTQSIFFHQLFHIGMTLGKRVKSAAIAMVYKKVDSMYFKMWNLRPFVKK